MHYMDLCIWTILLPHANSLALHPIMCDQVAKKICGSGKYVASFLFVHPWSDFNKMQIVVFGRWECIYSIGWRANELAWGNKIVHISVHTQQCEAVILGNQKRFLWNNVQVVLWLLTTKIFLALGDAHLVDYSNAKANIDESHVQLTTFKILQNVFQEDHTPPFGSTSQAL